MVLFDLLLHDLEMNLNKTSGGSELQTVAYKVLYDLHKSSSVAI